MRKRPTDFEIVDGVRALVRLLEDEGVPIRRWKREHLGLCPGQYKSMRRTIRWTMTVEESE